MRHQTDAAIAGCETAYLTVGLPYKTAIWQEQWPILMKNVLDAAQKHQCKLVFFDNVYMYGRVTGSMTEQTPFKQDSKKGTVRGVIANMVLERIANGSITGMICRAPEFYGPANTQSGVNALVFDNLRKGKKPQWLVNDEQLRTFIYTPDAAKATALLGNSPNAWGQTWHLPYPDAYISGKDFIALVASAMGKPVTHSIMSKLMVRIGGLFNSYAKEIIELLYQYDQDYCFNSDKFKKAYPNFSVTSYQQGITDIVKEFT